MRVKFLCHAVGPYNEYKTGQIKNFSDAKAKRLIKAGTCKAADKSDPIQPNEDAAPRKHHQPESEKSKSAPAKAVEITKNALVELASKLEGITEDALKAASKLNKTKLGAFIESWVKPVAAKAEEPKEMEVVKKEEPAPEEDSKEDEENTDDVSLTDMSKNELLEVVSKLEGITDDALKAASLINKTKLKKLIDEWEPPTE